MLSASVKVKYWRMRGSHYAKRTFPNLLRFQFELFVSPVDSWTQALWVVSITESNETTDMFRYGLNRHQRKGWIQNCTWKRRNWKFLCFFYIYLHFFHVFLCFGVRLLPQYWAPCELQCEDAEVRSARLPARYPRSPSTHRLMHSQRRHRLLQRSQSGRNISR